MMNQEAHGILRLTNGEQRDDPLVNLVNPDLPNSGKITMKLLLSQLWLKSSFIDITKIDVDDITSRDEVFSRQKDETKLRVALQRRRNNFIMYDRLKNRKIVTNEIETIARKITRNSGNK